jgi:uncharacterized protein YodC (DUF2158 family)
MGKYSITDFKVGDEVYHLSNSSLMMVVREVHTEMNEILCRWIDNKGNIQTVEFMPEELGKRKDKGPRIVHITA